MKDMEEEDVVVNRGGGDLSYTQWYDHITQIITGHWNTFLIYSLGCFGITWGLIEATSFFFPYIGLNSVFVLYIVLVLSLIVALSRCVYDYRIFVPIHLENETEKAHEIIRYKKHFWEYALAHELLVQRIEAIDQQLDDIANNRVHVNVTKSLDQDDYLQWIGTRPANLLGMIESAKKLLIFDLPNAIHSDHDDEPYVKNIIRMIDLVTGLYKKAYDFEIEGREIKAPDRFLLVHEIQFEWITVIREGFAQMLDLLSTVANRDKGNLEPVEGTIVFEEPPRLEEFLMEIERINEIIEQEINEIGMR